MNKRVFFHAGDLGDIIAALPAIRQLGGGRLVIGTGFCRESMKGARFNAIKPLLECQGYLSGVEWSEQKPRGALDLSNFRQNHRPGESLAHWQGRHLGIQSLDTSPWLGVNPLAAGRGRVFFARSERYGNGFYPWFALVKRYPDALFVGSQAERAAFEHEFGASVAYSQTRDLLELAQMLAGARLFCGNQSCPWWVAAGLGVTTFQETWRHDSNSVIPRPNAHYMSGAAFDLAALPL